MIFCAHLTESLNINVTGRNFWQRSKYNELIVADIYFNHSLHFLSLSFIVFWYYFDIVIGCILGTVN